MMRQSVRRAFAQIRTPPIANQPMKQFQPHSPEAQSLAEACRRQRGQITECPIMIGGQPYTSSQPFVRTMPSDHSVILAQGYLATPELAERAIECAMTASQSWRNIPFRDRAAIFLRAAHLLETRYADEMRAATMLGQSKNVWQAEIDCVAEACDFLRWNVHFAEKLYAQQPHSPALDKSAGVWNMTDYRPLEGFFSAITPFNFTAIAANLAGAPALMGNVVIWKPSPAAILSNFLMYRVFEAAGLPPGVINLLPCEVDVMDRVIHGNEQLAGVCFTGSTKVFTEINKRVYGRLEHYHSFPRITGETGGKDFHVIHPSADVPHAVAATLRAAFEYQGQKCSACSRAYVPQSCWNEFRELLLRGHAQLRMGQPDDFRSFLCAVIDEPAFDKISGYVNVATRNESGCYSILAGGQCDKSHGYFIQPTLVQTSDPMAQLMREEIFGPVLTIYVYDDSVPNFWQSVCELADKTTKYSLTGAVFARDREAIRAADVHLRFAAGNFYVNEKCTGAVVGQQPFGGARLSGSNDKPGSELFLTRFVSARTIKESFDASTTISYPHQLPDSYTLSPSSMA